MNFLRITACLFLTLAYASWAKEYLVVIDNLDEGKYDFPVIEEVGDHFIVLANEGDIQRMQTRRYTYRILDVDPREKDYTLIYPRDPQDPFKAAPFDRKVFEKYGTVLEVFDDCSGLLMRITRENVRLISEYVFEGNYLEMDPVDYTITVDPALAAMHRREVQANKLIEEMLKKVHKDSADKMQRELCDMHNRHYRDKWNKELLVPYLCKKLKAYGCDTVFQTPIPGCPGSDVVTGVKYGKKFPGMAKVCILGGHPDGIALDLPVTAKHPAAWDNASGTVTFLEAARVMKDYTFEYSIMYSGFNAEEGQCLGSAALFRQLKPAGVQGISGFNYDMTGWDKNGLRNTCNTAPGAADYAKRCRTIAETYKIDPIIKVNISDPQSMTMCDIINMTKYGYIGFNTMGGGGAGYNNSKDIINDKYNPEVLANTALLGIAVTADYAVPINSTAIEPTCVSKGSPSPFTAVAARGAVTVRLDLGRHDNLISMKIYTASGRVVADLHPQRQADGVSIAQWRYKTSGAVNANGLYFLHCTTDKGLWIGKIALME